MEYIVPEQSGFALFAICASATACGLGEKGVLLLCGHHRGRRVINVVVGTTQDRSWQ